MVGTCLGAATVRPYVLAQEAITKESNSIVSYRSGARRPGGDHPTGEGPSYMIYSQNKNTRGNNDYATLRYATMGS